MKGQAFVKQWMCKVVEVTHEFVGWKNGGTPEISKLADPVVGWVVGYTYRRPGTFEFDEYGNTYYSTKGKPQLVVLVRPWPHEKTLDVPLEHLRLTDAKPIPGGRLGKTAGESMNRRFQKAMRKEMQNWPRDERGRWEKR